MPVTEPKYKDAKLSTRRVCMIFDTHAHLNAHQYKEDLESVIQKSKNENVTNILVVGFDKETIISAIEIAENNEGIYAGIGWHPVDAIDFKDEHLVWIEELTNNPKVIAIGEIGLDYYWDKSPKDVQLEVFKKQINLAKKVKLPIIIHNRDATKDVLDTLIMENAEQVGGIMHCFNGSIETAQICMDLGFYLSIGGPVTFKNAVNLQKVVEQIPLDRLLVETDCPYLTPHPFRGKRNDPSYIKHIVQKIADIKNITFEEVAEATTSNAIKLLNINKVL
jgi:TatD DNase family protein